MGYQRLSLWCRFLERVGRFVYRLFFTRTDDLDLLQLLYVASIVFGGYAIAQVGAGAWRLPAAAWAFMGGVLATLAITGVPKWAAELVATNRAASALATAIAAAPLEPVLPTRDDDERDAHTRTATRDVR